MKYLALTARIIAGALFIFSGFVKAVDPMGSAFKFQDYLAAFGLGQLSGLALPLAVLLCLAEFLSGFSVLTGLRLKTGSWVMLLLMLFFTPLTLVLALTNPVSDCGCFGDAVHLTNWQTFFKNVILIIFVLIVFFRRKFHNNLLKRQSEWSIVIITGALFIGFNLYNLRYLPVIDFLPYKTGTVIREKMIIPEGAPADKYETTFIYEKDGVKKEFTLENYPASDTTWTFIDQKSKLVSKGYEPPIHGFSIIRPDGKDLTDSILSHKGYTLLMISRKLEKADRELLNEGFKLGSECKENGIGFIVMTASSSDVVNQYKPEALICQADETTLKTIIRSNPGYMLLKDGRITGKWSWAEIPRVNLLLKK